MIHKKLLSLLVLLMTAASGAWATVYNGNAKVNSEDLKVGDIIYDASINHAFKLAANRYKDQNNTVQTVISEQLQNIDIDDDGLLYQKYRPFTADGQDGNAWVVIEKMQVLPNSDEAQVLIGGIIYDPNSIYPDTDAETEGATFTTASFKMPASDATVSYDIVRNLADADYPVEFSGITGSVVVKQGGDNKYQPLTPLTIQLIDELAATDAQNIIADAGIKVKVLKGTLNGTTIEYDETNPIAYADFLADMEPGLYKIVAEPTDPTTSPYTGTASLAFQTLIGYPVEVPAGEYVTYYSDENLTVDAESGAVLYTITNVSGNTATATEIEIANAGMPFIIRNTSDEDQTFLLIPTENQINMSVYPGFKGTLDGKTFTAAEMAATDHYVVNNAQFVWVKDPGTIAAHRSWLELTKNSAARQLNIVFGDATAIDHSPLTIDHADGDIYDLQGRRVTKSAKKGVFIQNGKKVVK